MAEPKFSITEFMAESAEDSAIYLYAVNTLEKRVLELALDNIYRPYLWRDWATSQDVLERIYMADITPYLADIIEAIKGMGGGGNMTINCCLGADGAGTVPLPEIGVSGDYEGTGGVPDYTEEDAVIGEGGDSDKCRKAYYSANWIANLADMSMPNPETTDAVAITAIANRTIAQNSINTAVKLLPASDAAVVIDGVTGKIIRGGTAIGKVAKGGTLVGIIFYILSEVLAAAVRAELSKWVSGISVVANIIGSSTSYSELMDKLRWSGLVEEPLSAKRILRLLAGGAGAVVTSVGDAGAALCAIWWVAIQRGWGWFPDSASLAIMFPSVSCAYGAVAVSVTEYIPTVSPNTIFPTLSGGWYTDSDFQIRQLQAGGRTGAVWVGDRRLEWLLTDTTPGIGDYENWVVNLYEELPTGFPVNSTAAGAWLDANAVPDYQFSLEDYVAEGGTPSFPLRGRIMWIWSTQVAGTLEFDVRGVV